jgi:hypothetical protein
MEKHKRTPINLPLNYVTIKLYKITLRSKIASALATYDNIKENIHLITSRYTNLICHYRR